MSNGKTSSEVRSEAIAITQVSEQIANASCYCAMNEVAKDITFSSFSADKTKIAGYIQGAKCKEATNQAIRLLTRERATELRLK